MDFLGKHIKVIFKNGAQVEGIVSSWSSTQVVLKSEDGSSILMIMNISEDALAIKIVLDNKKPEQQMQVLQEQFQEAYEQPSNNDLRLMNLAKLKSAMIEQEKKIVAEKMREHMPSHVQRAEYGNPFIKK
jgi:sRNA-binding regulator protein Hfq